MAGAALEERIEEITDRVQKAGDNQVGRVAALEEYLTLACAREGETWFDAGAWSEDLAARLLWQQARAGYPGDVWVYVQAGIGYGDIGDHAGPWNG